MYSIEDHGLPLVQLKELRRELVMALVSETKPISIAHIDRIASLHYAIAAIEAVIIDLDAEQGLLFPGMKTSGARLAA